MSSRVTCKHSQRLEHVFLQPQFQGREHEPASPAPRPQPPRGWPSVAPPVVVEKRNDVRVDLCRGRNKSSDEAQQIVVGSA